jgi:hypothetical protein
MELLSVCKQSLRGFSLSLSTRLDIEEFLRKAAAPR